MGTVDPKKSLKMMRYVLGQIPGIMRRLHLGVLDGMQLVWLLASAYARELKSKATNEVRTLTPATRESLKLADFFMTRLIKTFSIEGKEYLDEAIRFFVSRGEGAYLVESFRRDRCSCVAIHTGKYFWEEIHDDMDCREEGMGVHIPENLLARRQSVDYV